MKNSQGHIIPANLTPRTEKLYAFGETPTYKLAEAFKKGNEDAKTGENS